MGNIRTGIVILSAVFFSVSAHAQRVAGDMEYRIDGFMLDQREYEPGEVIDVKVRVTSGAILGPVPAGKAFVVVWVDNEPRSYRNGIPKEKATCAADLPPFSSIANSASVTVHVKMPVQPGKHTLEAVVYEKTKKEFRKAITGGKPVSSEIPFVVKGTVPDNGRPPGAADNGSRTQRGGEAAAAKELAKTYPLVTVSTEAPALLSHDLNSPVSVSDPKANRPRALVTFPVSIRVKNRSQHLVGVACFSAHLVDTQNFIRAKAWKTYPERPELGAGSEMECGIDLGYPSDGRNKYLPGRYKLKITVDARYTEGPLKGSIIGGMNNEKTLHVADIEFK